MTAEHMGQDHNLMHGVGTSTSDPQEPVSYLYVLSADALDVIDAAIERGELVPDADIVQLEAEARPAALAAASPDSASPKFGEGWQAAIAAVRVGVGTLHLRSSLLLEDINRVLDALANDGPGRGAASPDSAPAGLDVWDVALALHETAPRDHNLGEGPLRAICDSIMAHEERAMAIVARLRATPASTTGPE